MSSTVRFVAPLLAGLLAGAALANFLLESTVTGPAAFEIQYKQLVVKALAVALPLLAVAAIAAGLVILYRSRADRQAMWLVAVAVVCLVVAVGTTLTVHLPLNAEILTWDPAAPPPDWAERLATWRSANVVRTVAAIAGFGLLQLAVLREQMVAPRQQALAR